MRYFAKFKKEKEGGYSVSFPSLKGCFSEGDSFEEAKTMAAEALLLWLESALEYDETIPAPKEFTDKEYVAIKVPTRIAVAVQLRMERGVTDTLNKKLEVNFA